MDKIVYVRKENQLGSGRPIVQSHQGRDTSSVRKACLTHTIRSLPNRDIQKGGRRGGRVHDHIVTENCGWLVSVYLVAQLYELVERTGVKAVEWGEDNHE